MSKRHNLNNHLIITCKYLTLTTALTELLEMYKARTERTLDHWLPAATTPPARLHEAMRYSTLNGGKRIRPALVYATGSALGVAYKSLDGPACSVEIIHAYSLIHDDLPAMDDDALRRGRATCHKAFDEATAILAGDALQSLSFQILVNDPDMIRDSEVRLKMLDTLALACGSRGMAGGQAIDLESTGKQLTLPELENMHIHKTGALIRASVLLGGMSLPGVDNSLLEKLDHYAKCIGLAFQIQDDILDVESDTETLGKTQGADIAQNKATYPSLIGMAEAKSMATDLHEQALDSLAGMDERADPLRWISEYIIGRKS